MQGGRLEARRLMIGHKWAHISENLRWRAVSSARVGTQENPHNGASWAMELAGLEPAASWVRSRRSPN
jgi:hypothetical protein